MTVNAAYNIRRRFAGLLLACLLFAGSAVGMAARVSAVSAPNILNYQGRLLNANGVPVADSTASMKFELYSASSGGTCIWSNSSATCDSNTPASTTARTVTLTDGLFSENLGDTAHATPYAAIADSVFADNATVHLKVTVNSEPLDPRKAIVSAPYAINSDTLDGFDSSQVGGTTAVALVLDTTGNLQLTGSPQGTGVAQGSLYINPATGVVASNEIVFGVAVSGTSRFTIDGEGDTALLGDFIVGGSSLAAPFSIDESLNTLRLGDGTSDANDPTITFYASDATDSGSFSYADTDAFTFAGGDFSLTSLGTIPTSASSSHVGAQFSATYADVSNATLAAITLNSLRATTTYTAEEGTATDHYVEGISGQLSISGSAELTRGYGVRGLVSNASLFADVVPADGYLTGVEGEFIQSSGNTLFTGSGMHGVISAVSGFVTEASAVFGETRSGAGTLTSSTAGRFINTAAGTTRYGVFAQASGGATANYAGYFAGAAVQIDDDTTANTPGTATGAGDLYVADAIESDGGVTLGDTTGTDQFNFTSAKLTGGIFALTTDSVTSGTSMALSRAAGGDDFTGKLLSITQSNTSGTSTGSAAYISQQSAGGAGLYIVQNTLGAHSGATVGNTALVIDVNEASAADNIATFRSDADGTPDIEFRVQSDGKVFADDAVVGTGADYAEFFLTSDAGLTSYELVCQDRSTAHAVKKCEAGNSDVMGVISTNAAFVGNNFVGANGNLSTDPNYRKVGMVGQIETLVNAGEGAIAVGDPLTTSSSLNGYGARSYGPARIVGFALEPLASGTGTIRVLVQPQWYGGDVLTSDGAAIVSSASIVAAPLGVATAVESYSSNDITLRGSGWSSGAAANKDMTLRTSVTDGSAAYRLSVVNNNGSEVAYIGEAGDVALAGHLYPSDRGTLQTSKYIHYDGSSGAGGDVMRTNSGGWGTGSYDFAEMFPSQDALAPGEIVTFAESDEEVQRSTGIAYDDKIAGIISTRPGFVAGDNLPGHVAVALSGRVPTYVSGENGAIAIGDPLTTSTKRGYAMKATEAGPIVGYAMEAFSGTTTGVVVAFVRPSYYDGADEAPAAENTASELASVAHLNIAGSMNMSGGNIISVASISGIGGNWRLSENGDLATRGRIIGLIRGYDGEEVETAAVLGREATIQLSGTATLRNGRVDIKFADVDPSFSQIIANTIPYRVMVTPYSATGQLYVAEREQLGFVIREAGDTSGVLVDWLVIAYHKDFAPEPSVVADVLADEVTAPIEEIVAPSIDETVVDVPAASEQAEPEIVVAPTPEETITEETTGLDNAESDVILAPSVDESVVVIDEPAAEEPAAAEIETPAPETTP